MHEKNYIKPYCKAAGKILGNVLGIGIIAALVTYFAFKSYFNIVMAFYTVILIITVIMLVVSFIAAIIFDVNASEKLKGWQKSLISGILAMIDMVAARAMCLIFTNLSWNATPDAKMFNQVINGAFAALIAATLIDLVTCGKRSLRDEIKDTDLSYDRIKRKAGIFYLTELQVFIVALFAAALFFPATYFIKFAVSPLYYAIELVIAVFAVLAVVALIQAVCVCVQYKYQKARELLHEEIMELLDQRLFLTKEDIEELCQITYPKYTARYPRLIDQILSDEVDKGRLKQTTVNNELVYTAKDPRKLKKEYFKKISILNKKDLLVLGIGTGLMLIKSMLAVPFTAQMLGFGSGYTSSQRLDHNAGQIIKSEQNRLKKFINNHKGMSDEAKKILSSMSVPFDVTKGSKIAGVNLGGANHRFATLGHDPVLGYFFGVINILTNTITTNTFSTFRVVENEIVGGSILFTDILKEALDIVSRNPDCLLAAIKKESEHLRSDAFTKKSLQIPGTELIPHKFVEKMYQNHFDFFNTLNAVRDTGFVITSAIVSEFLDMIIEAVHELTFDPQKENKGLFDIRTKIIVMTADNIATISNATFALATHNFGVLDFGGIFISIWKTITAFNAVFGTYWNLKYDPTDTPKIIQLFNQYNQLKQESSLQQT